MNSTIEEILIKYGFYAGPPHGSSMYPTLRNMYDTVHIIKLSEKLKKYDAVLYRRKSGQLVLHRIIKIQKDGYVMCGDSQFQKEFKIQETQILGIMDSFYRGEKQINCNGKFYKVYVKIWCFSFPTKKMLMAFYNLLCHIRGWINGKKFN